MVLQPYGGIYGQLAALEDANLRLVSAVEISGPVAVMAATA
jgi:hypothetical protein